MLFIHNGIILCIYMLYVICVLYVICYLIIENIMMNQWILGSSQAICPSRWGLLFTAWSSIFAAWSLEGSGAKKREETGRNGQWQRQMIWDQWFGNLVDVIQSPVAYLSRVNIDVFFSGSYVIHLLAYHRMSTTLGARLQTGPSGISQLVSTPLTDGLHAPWLGRVQRIIHLQDPVYVYIIYIQSGFVWKWGTHFSTGLPFACFEWQSWGTIFEH